MLSSASAFAAESSCEGVFAATDTTAQTPFHAYVTVQLMKGMPPQNSEEIFAGGIAYTNLDGHWQRDPMTAEKTHQAVLETRKQFAHECRAVGSEAVGGVSATHYEMRVSDPASGPVHGASQLWISSPGNLLLRERIEMSKDSFTETRYEYAEVHAPSGVK